MLDGGASSLDWSGWTGNQRENITYDGWYASGGAVLQVYPRPLLGEVSCLWTYSSDDCEGHPLWYMRWQGLLKYSWELVPVFHVTGGLGLYAETPPPAGDYDGGGPAVSIGCGFAPSEDWRILFRLLRPVRQCRYRRRIEEGKTMVCNSESCAKWDEFKHRPLAEANIPPLIFVLAAVCGILAAGYRCADSGASAAVLTAVVAVSAGLRYHAELYQAPGRSAAQQPVAVSVQCTAFSCRGQRTGYLYRQAAAEPVSGERFTVERDVFRGRSRQAEGFFDGAPGARVILHVPPESDFAAGDVLDLSGVRMRAGRTADYHRRRGIAAVYYCSREPAFADRTATGRGAVRRIVRTRLGALPDARVSGMLLALYSGNSSYIAPVTANRFRCAGLAHVLAASGMHVGIVAGVPLLLCVLLRLPRRMRVLLPLPFVAGYLHFSDAPPSLMRAVLMSLVCAWQYMLFRRVRPFRALYYAMIILLLLRPYELYSAAFQLSSAATAGILLGCAGVRHYLPRWPRYFNANLAVGVPAQMAVLPVLWVRFGAVQLNGLLCGPLVTPLLALAMRPVRVHFCRGRPGTGHWPWFHDAVRRLSGWRCGACDCPVHS
jgi:ComEC/Rec2-related protein